jgi:dTDP-4-dehydrorhamnose reductase
MTPALLITGISGVAGTNALPYFRANRTGPVFGLKQPDNDQIHGPDLLTANAEDRHAVRRVLEEQKIGAILDCAGNCALKSCELDPAMARRVNVEGPVILAEEAARLGLRLVHLSIDLVFSGRTPGRRREDDPTDPVTVYGRTMVEAEQAILAIHPAACILRISLPMGISLNGHAGAIDWIQSRFKKERPATLYVDEVRSPTYTDCLNRVCAQVLERPLSGILHAGGPRHLSLYQIAQIVNKVGGYDPRLLMGCPRLMAGPVPPRAGDVSLDSARLASLLGWPPFDPWPLDEHLVPTHYLWHHDRPYGWPGSPEFLARVLYRNPRLCSRVA